ncbi:MAG: CapA family protein [Leptospiraceae bacterium]|nr:CapA family protein [Leptospiraceae bacterium]MCP5494214.1 CapA family protein [Leptospiraceae bacterium]
MRFVFIFFLCCSLLHAENRNNQDRVKILVAGDVMFDWGLNKSRKNFGEFAPIKELIPLMEEVDFRMVNLETPICSSKNEMNENKSYVFRGEPKDLYLLKKLNIDLVFLGNNHAMDYGAKGLEETIENVEINKLLYSGAGLNLSKSLEPIRFSIKDSDFKLVSVSSIGLPKQYATSNTPGVAPYKLDSLVGIARKNKKDALMLSVHWGIEYNLEPEGYQRQQAKRLIQSGFKVIIGHHPHIPQGVEKYKNGIILYSLGNFIFGSMNQNLNHNMAAILHFEKNELVLCELVPIYGKFQKIGSHIFRPLTESESEMFLYEILILSEKLNTKVEIKNGRGYVYF